MNKSRVRRSRRRDGGCTTAWRAPRAPRGADPFEPVIECVQAELVAAVGRGERDLRAGLVALRREVDRDPFDEAEVDERGVVANTRARSPASSAL